tara:strand:+ start:3547 stop:3969 length:423 start_codon:yes stop_codon:yes gene_type:complete
MAHFAQLDEQNLVTQVTVVSNDIATSEEVGINFLRNIFGQSTNWKQTSYNTRKNKYFIEDEDGHPVESEDQSKAFRGNFASIGYTYDTDNDVFIEPKPYDSWVLNETEWTWEAPVAVPEDTENKRYEWDEDIQEWVSATT